ncbi:Tyrosine-protein phosphatase non-receptor type [Dirofilaria immitis]
MNKFVRKVTAAFKDRKNSTERKSANKEKKDSNEKKDLLKVTKKDRIRTFFNRRSPKKDECSSSSKTQMTVLDELAATKEMENLKKDLKHGSAYDQATKWSDLLLDKGIIGLEMEFEKLNKVVEKIESKGFDANAERNFSKEVICQDKQRVLLKNEANNYIHANYINTPNFNKHFICTQRPMLTTIESFYKMLLQEHVECVIMLCSFAESTEKKCAPYFPHLPTENPMKFGSITVKCITIEKMKYETNIIITTLAIIGAGKKQFFIKHYHWENWPDKDPPDSSLTIFNLLCLIRQYKKPIVVHCSDGVGRSMIFITIEYVLQKLIRGENCADFIDVIKEIRNQRAMAIRTVWQYILLNRLLLQFFQELNIVDMSQRLLEFIDDYDAYIKKHKDEKK